ncbi:MAG: alpha/beta fold hydrolase [Pseudomonadota bacterium]
MALETTWREVDGRRVRERVGGVPDAPPLVLVHGLGVTGRYLVPVAERLAAAYRVHVPDLPDEVADVPGRRRALAAWMDAAEIARAPLLANSLGCQIVVDLAAAEPERVEALVLVGPTVDPRARTVRRQLARLLATAPAEPLALDALVVAEYASHPLRTFRAARGMVEDRIEAKLPLLRCPVLVVRGERDRIVPQAWAEEAARLAGGRLEVLAGAHALNFARPDELARVTLRFLR